ncbi:MAG TPA: hypothetical protein VM124_01110 [Candidatus Limnocylindrales bacterium]|nr:hypothetical protein [Candidatus Limnocylindrales bacterium]
MEPSLIHSLIGNLGISPDLSNKFTNSPGSKTRQKNKVGKGVQIVVNVNGVIAEKRHTSLNSEAGTYKEGYHAVFLDNNQVYFGKLRRFADSARFVSLKDVYYLRDISEAAVLNFDLIKLGSEIHSPEDEMHINISKILFWEKLKDDGPIVTAILNFEVIKA